MSNAQKEEHKGYHAVYKCRLCEHVFFYGMSVCPGRAQHHVMELVEKGKPEDDVQQFPRLLDKHLCCDGSIGLADFIGWYNRKDG